MSAEEIIDLGSSDDEKEPAPKKAKYNPIVHIPKSYTKLPGITITPSSKMAIKKGRDGTDKAKFDNKQVFDNCKISAGVSNRLQNIKKVPNIPIHIHSESPVIPSKFAKEPNFQLKLKNISTGAKFLNNLPPTVTNLGAKAKSISQGPKPTNNLPTGISNFKGKIKIMPQSTNNLPATLSNLGGLTKIISKSTKPVSNLHSNISNLIGKTKIMPQGNKLLNNLPAGITIKRASNALRINPFNVSRKRSVIVSKEPQALQSSVEIDDEENSGSPVPQWYKRPEDDEPIQQEVEEEKISNLDIDNNIAEYNSVQETKSQEVDISMEDQNNREPEPNTLIEITIEDSPVKPVHSKLKTASNSIVIEDSPVKGAPDKTETLEYENDKHSKKKLEYLNEISLAEKQNDNKTDPIKNSDSKSETEVNEPAKETSKNTDDNSNIKDKSKDEESVPSLIQNSDKQLQFNPVYQKFIDTCFEMENSDDMKKIVEKKIKAYYKQCSKEYVDSDEFVDLVSGKILAIKSSPDKMYLYIKDVVDELNMQRKLTKATESKEDIIQENKQNDAIKSDYSTKRERQIRKLEKTLKKLHRAVQKLEEQEVDFDDEDDSVYLLAERYKERLVKVHKKFCQLTNTKMPSEPSIKLEPRPGRPSGPVRRIEKLINKKVPIGAPLPFPDFHDVLRCVRDANDEDKLGWTEMEIIEEARDLFTTCGKKLQRRRQENEWRIAASRLPVNEDPAEKDEDLKKILDNNKQLASKKEAEVFNKYVDRQIQLKLVAEEIGDKEAEESPIESEEEDDTESSNLLKDKNNRKDRLKRLLQEKSKLDVDKSEDSKSEVKEKDNKRQNENKEKDKDDKENPGQKILQAKAGDEDNKVESDIDELHLLQKLYSEDEVDSSSESSSIVSAISLSDTDSDDKKQTTISISIENSSYSESENTVDDTFPVIQSGNIDNENQANKQENSETICHNDTKESENDTKTKCDLGEASQSIETIKTNTISEEISELIQSSPEPECMETEEITEECFEGASKKDAIEVEDVEEANDNGEKISGSIDINNANNEDGDGNEPLELSEDENNSDRVCLEEDSISIHEMCIGGVESNQIIDEMVGAGPQDVIRKKNERRDVTGNDHTVET